MRGAAGYEETRALLAERGYSVDESEPYTGEHFGSWLIVVSTAPRLRIIWDGKDSWAIIQAELARKPSTPPQWEDMWVGKQTEDITPSACVDAVERFQDFATEARKHGA